MYASVGREVCRGMQGSRGPWGLVGGYLGRGGEGSLPYASNDLGAREKKELEYGTSQVYIRYILDYM